MTIRLTRGKLTGVGLSLMAGLLMLAAASDSYAGPRGGDSGKLFRPPQSIKPAPSPVVRDHRGGGRYENIPPKASPQTAKGGVVVDGREGKVDRPGCKDTPGRGGGCQPWSWVYGKNWQNAPKGSVRDHRSK